MILFVIFCCVVALAMAAISYSLGWEMGHSAAISEIHQKSMGRQRKEREKTRKFLKKR